MSLIQKKEGSIIDNINGFRVATDVFSGVETVTVSVCVGIGSSNELDTENGISHFLEHMAFKGTETRSAKDISEQIERVGGYMNAYTSKDNTVYYIKVLKEHLELAIDILSDIMQNSVFDAKELEVERGVILQELASSQDTPDDIIFDYFMETAFANQAVGRPILGTEQTINSFQKHDFENYIGKNYNADSMVLAVSGNVSHADVVKYATKYFTKLNPVKKVSKGKIQYSGGEFRKQNDNLSQVQYVLGFKGISKYDDKKYISSILWAVLAGGMSSRLFQEIREKRGLVYTISNFNMAFDTDGVCAIYAGTSPDKLEELSKSICHELKNSIAKIEQHEIDKAFSQSKAGILMSRESTTSRSHKLGLNLLTHGREITEMEMLVELEKVKLKDVQNFLQELIGNNNISLSAYGKLDNLPTLSSIKDYLK